jgi:hypothetical protein
MKLLSVSADAKTVKGEKKGYLTGISTLRQQPRAAQTSAPAPAQVVFADASTQQEEQQSFPPSSKHA